MRVMCFLLLLFSCGQQSHEQSLLAQSSQAPTATTAGPKAALHCGKYDIGVERVDIYEVRLTLKKESKILVNNELGESIPPPMATFDCGWNGNSTGEAYSFYATGEIGEPFKTGTGDVIVATLNLRNRATPALWVERKGMAEESRIACSWAKGPNWLDTVKKVFTAHRDYFGTDRVFCPGYKYFYD